MIKIGKRISIIDCDSMINKETKVLFDEKEISTVTHFEMKWGAVYPFTRKECALSSYDKRRDNTLEEFAIEMTKNGFWAEITYVNLGLIVEFCHSEGNLKIEEKKAFF